LAESSSFCDAI